MVRDAQARQGLFNALTQHRMTVGQHNVPWLRIPFRNVIAKQAKYFVRQGQCGRDTAALELAADAPAICAAGVIETEPNELINLDAPTPNTVANREQLGIRIEPTRPNDIREFGLPAGRHICEDGLVREYRQLRAGQVRQHVEYAQIAGAPQRLGHRNVVGRQSFIGANQHGYPVT